METAQAVTDVAQQKRLDPDCTGESRQRPPGLQDLGQAPLLQILLNKGMNSKQSSDKSLTRTIRFQTYPHKAQPGNQLPLSCYTKDLQPKVVCKNCEERWTQRRENVLVKTVYILNPETSSLVLKTLDWDEKILFWHGE